MIRSLPLLRRRVRNCILSNAKIVSYFREARQFHSSESFLNEQRQKLDTLYRHLYSKMLACGPMTVAEYMKEILTHPDAGYYMCKDVFGKKGDFITSPEITQLFGELIGIWIIYEWRKISRHPFQVVELGPGRGTLIKDILKVFKKIQILDKVSIHLVEISPALSLIQAKNLCTTIEEHGNEVHVNQNSSIGHYRKGITEDGTNVYWYYSVKDVPREFSVFVAHEFFDVLPIHKFQRTDNEWREVLIDIIEGNNEEKFRYVLSNMSTPATKLYISEDETRDHVEVCPESMVIVDYISQFLWECGGFALICDYGHSGEKTDTFRAFYQHKLHDPLTNVGKADLTADVDFSVLKQVAEKDNRLITFGPVTQNRFLKNMGIDVRLEVLLKTASEKEKEQLESGYRMIVNEDNMGKRFKFLSLFPSVLKEYFKKIPVAGFEKEESNV